MAANSESPGKSRGRARRLDEADIGEYVEKTGGLMSMSWRPFQPWYHFCMIGIEVPESHR
jgi:hypothetical protein